MTKIKHRIVLSTTIYVVSGLLLARHDAYFFPDGGALNSILAGFASHFGLLNGLLKVDDTANIGTSR